VRPKIGQLAFGHGPPDVPRLECLERHVEIRDGPRGRAEVDVAAIRPAPTEPRRALTVGLPLLRPARLELVLEKGTELGVTRFVPMRTTRGRDHGCRPERWARIVRTASMQCLRSKLPEVCPVMDLQEVISGGGACDVGLVGRPGGEPLPASIAGDVIALVGPEGDFTPDEWSAIAGAGFLSVDLGPRRLRAETAALSLLAGIGLTTGPGA